MTEMDEAAVTPVVKDEDEINLAEIFAVLVKHWKVLIGGSLGAGVLALGVAFLIPPTYTARAVFLPPQPQQGATASAMASLGALASLAGGFAGVHAPADQYVALMESATVADRMVDRFGLMKVYEAEYRVDARKALAKNTHISVGKKDGLITVEVDDHSRQRASDMANQYIDELRAMTDTIAISEAQQRRKFFEQQLQQTKQRLIAAQQALQSSGVSEAAIKTDPKASAQAYAALQAQATAAEVKLQAMRSSLAEGAPEIRQQQSLLTSLRQQLASLAQPAPQAGGPDYVGKYREFKYQEALFEIYAKEYELARADESREGALIQVVDRAVPPEKKSRPKRALIAIGVTLASGIVLASAFLFRHVRRRKTNYPPCPGPAAR
jgi:uncharacterized protein involved in exopolysaccharide biosynthesis